MTGRRRRAGPVTVGALALVGAVLVAGSAAGWFRPGAAVGGASGSDGSSAAPAATPSEASTRDPIGGADPVETARTPEPREVPETRAPGLADAVDATWVAAVAAATGIPERAVASYAGAELRLRAELPGCGVDWATLAGIGWVESHHGEIDGRVLGADGRPVPEVIGIALDGTSTALIRDTDGGALDGDATWDRAVGPMQFIPGTWERYAADGDGDGETDPHQLDDAVLAAARYLCAAGGDLTRGEGWIAAVAAYNDSDAYNARVAEATSSYRATASGIG